MTTDTIVGTRTPTPPPSGPSRPKYWSEAVRTKTRRDNPPVVTFIIHLLIGIVLIGLLGVPFLLLQLEARRNIAFLSTDGEVRLTQADPELAPQKIVNRPPQGLSFTAQSRVTNVVPLPGLPTAALPVWSAGGDYLATTVWQEDGSLEPAIYDGRFQSVSTINSPNDALAIPADGWSKVGSVVALVEFDGARPLLTLAAPPFNTPIFFDFSLDPRAGIDWHPDRTDLLVTGFTEELPMPNLFLVNTTDNQPQQFAPGDRLSWRADGAWSPDGDQVAYIAGDVYTPTQNILPGTLWTVNSDGANVTQISPHRRVIAPVWSPDGDFIYYTLFSGPAGKFGLYRVPSDGSEAPVYIGPSSEYVLQYAWDRSLLFQWSPNEERLLFIGSEMPLPDYYLDQAPELIDLGLSETAVPILGVSAISPDNMKFVGTILSPEGIQAVVFPTPGSQPILTPGSEDDFVIPTDGWSPNSNIVTILRYEEPNTRLTFMDLSTTNPRFVTSQLLLDVRAGFDWHPSNDLILVTAIGDTDTPTPTLRIYNPADDTSEIFEPMDNQVVRADGVWSPDGNQVAYVAYETLTPTVDLPILAGPLWVASSSGQGARELVSEGLNFAPIWDVSQNRIIFTRYMTETESYDLYQVDLSGNNEERIGKSSEVFARYPFDRQYFLRWSPEGVLWQLPGAISSIPFTYYLLEDNVASVFNSGCNANQPYAIRWTPTNRGALVACPGGNMFVRWLDREREDSVYPKGLFPVWEP